MSDEDTTGLPPLTPGARLSLAGLDDEETIYQLSLMVFLTFNRFAEVMPDGVYVMACKMASHALLDLQFERGAPVPVEERKITGNLSRMPENIRIEFSGMNDEQCIQHATMSTLAALASPGTPEITLGRAAALYTNTLLELGFHR